MAHENTKKIIFTSIVEKIKELDNKTFLINTFQSSSSIEAVWNDQIDWYDIVILINDIGQFTCDIRARTNYGWQDFINAKPIIGSIHNELEYNKAINSVTNLIISTKFPLPLESDEWIEARNYYHEYEEPNDLQ